jgi:putative N6-adenine-specific DNA methylase
MVCGKFPAESFDQLFEGVRALPWHDWLPREAAFPVSGKCVRAQLMSVSDCQAITKKAIVEKMKTRYNLAKFPETGAVFPIEVSVRGGEATITIDTSGEALNRRGYRTWNGEAPLRETLAAAMISLSGWRGDAPLHDPMCGTGTLLIEAAMIAADRAPGLTRSFACESYHWFPPMKDIRDAARVRLKPDRAFAIAGGDIDTGALELARRHISQAGFEGRIRVIRKNAADYQQSETRGTFVCNPPYGVRIGDAKSSEDAIRALRALRDRNSNWRLAALSAHPGFERVFGKRANRKPRVYNGRLECGIYCYDK